MYCMHCGKKIDENLLVCPHCGTAQNQVTKKIMVELAGESLVTLSRWPGLSCSLYGKTRNLKQQKLC